MLYIDVPYEEKDEAKSLGAKWDSNKKKWYVTDKSQYPEFVKWIVGNCEDVVNIICDEFYVVETKRICYKCGKPTRVIGFAVSSFFDITNDYDNLTFDFYENDFCIESSLEFLSQNFLKYLKNQYNYYPSYSKTLKRKYVANHCDHCKALQGDFHLFCEPSSPFFIDTIEKAQNLKFYRFKLSHDIVIYDGLSYSDEKSLELVNEYSKFFRIYNSGIYSALDDSFLKESEYDFRQLISGLKSNICILHSSLVGTNIDIDAIEEG